MRTLLSTTLLLVTIISGAFANDSAVRKHWGDYEVEMTDRLKITQNGELICTALAYGFKPDEGVPTVDGDGISTTGTFPTGTEGRGNGAVSIRFKDGIIRFSTHSDMPEARALVLTNFSTQTVSNTTIQMGEDDVVIPESPEKQSYPKAKEFIFFKGEEKSRTIPRFLEIQMIKHQFSNIRNGSSFQLFTLPDSNGEVEIEYHLKPQS